MTRRGWLLCLLFLSVCSSWRICIAGDTFQSSVLSSKPPKSLGSTRMGRELFDSIQHQGIYFRYHTPVAGHKNTVMWQSRMKGKQDVGLQKSLWFSVRVGLAGGLAGATATGTLYPFDAAKTLRQTSPNKYKSVTAALGALWTQNRIYKGWWTSVLGSMPSSAIYFAAYESMKKVIKPFVPGDTFWDRLTVHAAAAASGNVLSSAVFVPKELIKQQMQYVGTGVGATILNVLQDRGIQGLYCGYQATLLRNIPSAVLRFVLYEELRRQWYIRNASSNESAFSWRLFAAGAVAGSFASGLMTPVDVLKTRLATGTCPVDMPGCLQLVLQEDGWGGLYAGAGSRMALSGAFSAIGFASFEAVKRWLGVSDVPNTAAKRTVKQPRVRAVTGKESLLEHALSDVFDDTEQKR